MSCRASTLGEVDADNGRGKWGAQVIALGEGKFTLVGYEGGLPGEGWKRGDRREMADGKTEGNVTRFQADQWEAEIKDGVLAVSTAGGSPVGKLKKVESQEPHARREAAARGDGIVRWQFRGQFRRRRSSRPTSCSRTNAAASSRSAITSCTRILPALQAAGAARRAATVASMCRAATKCRCSTRSDWKARTTSAAGSTRSPSPSSTCAIRRSRGRRTTSSSLPRDTRTTRR